jgi:hypothetical protein
VSQQLPIAQMAYSQAQALRDGLAPQDQPVWLAPIEGALHSFCDNHRAKQTASALNKAIAMHWAAMDKQQWTLESEDIAFDFDRIFEKHYKTSRIPELFDKLVDLLTQLIEAKDEKGHYVIQNRGAIEAIEKLIATLKKNRNASLYSIVCTYNFLMKMAKTFAWKRLQRFDLIEDLVASFQEHVEHLRGEMDDVNQHTTNELRSTISVDFYAVEVSQNFFFQGDDMKLIGKDENESDDSEVAESGDA